MNEQLNWFTILLNNWFGGAANALLKAVHVAPADAAHPIPNFVAASIAVALLTSLFFLWLRPRISADRPGGTQQVLEMMLTNPMGVGIRDLLEQNIQHGAREYLPLVGSISIFILFSNLIGVIPAFESPTGHPSVPLACAMLTFVF
jgi:F-type H+-transporting ATPase subunit a